MKKISLVFIVMITGILCLSLLPTQAQDSATLTGTPSAEATVQTLRDLFVGPDCPLACWLGIKPGMTREEVEALLKANGVTYEVYEPQLDGGQLTYYVTGGYSHPDVSFDEESIYIWLMPHDETYRVDGVQFSLKGVSVEKMVAAFGTPALIFQYTRQTPRPATFEAAYPSQGLGFRVTNVDQVNAVTTAYVMSEDAFLKAYQYNPEFSGVYLNCDKSWQICSVPTATPAPETLSERAADPATLRDLVTSPDCASACWLGIDVGMSEEEMVAALDANDITYVIQSAGEDAVNYRITGGYKNPAVAPGFVNSIILWVSRGDTEPSNAVTSIELLLSDMPVNDLIAALGAPTHVLAQEDYNGGFVYFAYEGQGLVFAVAYDHVRAVDLLPDVTGYTNFYAPLESCPPDSQMCVVPTATAMATPTP